MVDLVPWSSLSCFKEFCLDRLAVGLHPDLIAQDVSAFVGRVVPVEQVVASNSESEVLVRRKELLLELRSTAPVISRELLSIMGRIKKVLAIAEENAEAGDIESFYAYLRTIEIQLKAIDSASSQLNRLADSTRSVPSIVIQFGVGDLQRLESAGAVKIIDAELAGDLLGGVAEKGDSGSEVE